jgi:hypothetical protein
MQPHAFSFALKIRRNVGGRRFVRGGRTGRPNDENLATVGRDARLRSECLHAKQCEYHKADCEVKAENLPKHVTPTLSGAANPADVPGGPG